MVKWSDKCLSLLFGSKRNEQWIVKMEYINDQAYNSALHLEERKVYLLEDLLVFEEAAKEKDEKIIRFIE